MENETKAIIEGMARVEAYNNAEHRQPNPNGNYPLCKPRVGDISSRCERCGEYAGYDRPCPAIPREQRWGRDYHPR